MERFVKRLFVVVLLSGMCMAGYGQSRAIVDIRGDKAVPVPVGDSTAMAIVGHVMFHHNGAILSCDSAVRYSPDYIECFDNVIINRDSTYVYGDRADFNGITNIASVYAPIVKTVDGDMTMYSYDMEFNTLTNIGRFTRGGTIAQRDNLMEAVEAIYHADERDIFFVRDVVMRNEEYIIQTDSMGYNFDTEIVTFYRPGQIWNKDGDFLSADEGTYDRINDTYSFTRNSYILTKDQEVFADSITYLKSSGLAYMFKDIQIHDQVQLAYLFGDIGVYWTDDQQAVMSENPSAIAYDEAENPDSVYLRGDIMMMHQLESTRKFTEEIAAQLTLPTREQLDSIKQGIWSGQVILRPDSLLPDSLSSWGHLYGEGLDSTALERGMRGELLPDSLAGGILPDSIAYSIELADSLGSGLLPDSLASGLPIGQARPVEEPSRQRYPLITDPPAPEPQVEENIPAEQPDTVKQETSSMEEQTPAPAKSKRQIRQERRLERRRQQMQEYAEREGLLPVDTLPAVDSLPPIDSALLMGPVDSLPKDSLQRVVRAFRNVRIFRSDLQAVCDSLVAYSIDSAMHMYGAPVLWNEESQITADIVRAYSRNQQLDWAEFEGEPLIAQWVLDSLYNQITGDKMEAFFRDNDIVRMDVLQNAKSYYYMQQDGRPGEIGGFLDLKSQDITILFDSLKISYIIPKVAPEYIMYPMEKIPDTQPQRFPNFVWHDAIRPKTHFEVCDRPLRSSQRAESESIPYPQFRITDRIDQDKKRFIQQNIWRDRSDILSVDPSYFRNQRF